MNKQTDTKIVNEPSATEEEIAPDELEAIAGGMLACNKSFIPCVWCRANGTFKEKKGMNKQTDTKIVNEPTATEEEIAPNELETIAGGMLACNKSVIPCV
jgi:hypothetical protein